MKQFYILFFYCTVYIVKATKFKHETQHHSISDLKEFFEKEIETMQLKQDQIVKNMKAEMAENNNLLEQKMINMKMKFYSENNDKTGKIKQLEEQLKKQEKRFVAEIIDLQQKLNKIGSGRRNIITKQACSIEVKNLSNTVTRFTKEVLKLKDDIDRVDNDVKVIEKTMKGVNKDKRTNYTDSEDSAEGNTAFVQSIRHQGRGSKRQVSGDTGSRVAFFATLTHSDAVLARNERILFDNVVTNLGLAFHNGVFVAPVPGLYVFSVNLLSDSEPANAKVVRNGGLLGALNFHVDGEQASQTVAVELNRGDEIAVQSANYPGVKFYGYRHSSFSGFLLYEYNHPLVGK